MTKRLLIFLVICLAVNLVAQNNPEPAARYADTKLATMDLDAKLGQLFMIRAHSDLGQEHISSVESQIKKYKVGGLCFFQGTPTKQAELTNKYQSLSETPLMIAQDAEWGLGMRLVKSTISFPKQMTLGAISDNTLIYEMGATIAQQLQRIGVHVNFAPVVDINNNPNNPVIHNRSFGENSFNVSTKSYAYTKGLQDNGVVACMKHFPGHGDTDVDSHYDLPLITHNRARLDSLELMPFRILTQLGVKSVMTAHLAVPALDDTPNLPASLSRKVVTELLQDQYNFDGLIFTDGLEMQGVAKHFAPGLMELAAIKAGNDIMLLPIDIEKAIKLLKEEVTKGTLDISVVDQKVKKILAAKYELGLTGRPYIKNISSIQKELNAPSAINLKRQIYEKAVTLVKDENNTIPIIDNDAEKVAVLSLGTRTESTFQQTLKRFGYRQQYNVAKGAKLSSSKLKKLKSFETVIVSLHDMNIYAGKDFGLTEHFFDIIYQLSSHTKVVLVNHGSPYALKYFHTLPTLVQAYEEDEIMQDVVAQAIMGVSNIEGQLPVSVYDLFPVSTGLSRKNIMRLGYASPETVQVSSDSLLAIDEIIEEMIGKKAAPGCQILAARKGKIFYHKTFGHHTYDKKRKVKPDDIYDVASITKILSTTISLMKLQDDGKLNVHHPLKTYLPELDTSNKGPLIIADVLAHQAGLAGWIAFYEETLDKDSKKPKRMESYYRAASQDSFELKINDRLFLRNDFRDTIYKYIYNNDLKPNKNYRYSDLGFYLFHQIIEKQSGLPLDVYAQSNFYKPLGLNHTTFNPLNKFPKEHILPSEKDDYWRKGLVHGYVHDMGAAMLGGVAGHAGLFSSAEDIAVMMQMLLNGGSYAGRSYLRPETISKFTKRYLRSTRRGLGFDMKQLDDSKTENVAESTSESAFGHLGFTGISVFADPEYDLIYIFLSNRTYPTMENKTFARENYRPRVQEVFYNALMDVQR